MLKEFVQERSLRKNASNVPTGLLPLEKVKQAVVFLDVEDTSFDSCKNAILSTFKAKGIKADIFFLDLRRLSKDERLITSITTTVLRKDLNWYGRPSREKVQLMLSGQPDLFISLIPAPTYAIEFMASCSRARFKVGRWNSPVFDLVFDAGINETDAFAEIVKLMEKIS
ncbi:MAG: hypothetical protein J5835_07315 [Bacteroidales bacterium]|nr:hypothetical protein [Bacteroidales bacterium]